MAQIVRYYQDLKKEEYTEGPFVVCEIHGKDDCRLEEFLIRNKCPVLPSCSVYDYCKKHNLKTRGTLKETSRTVDHLNKKVKKEK